MRERRFWLVSLFIVGAICGIYGQTGNHGFINYDDEHYISRNPEVVRGLSGEGFVWAFGYHANNWHPLTWLSHMLDVQLFGMWAGGHHLVSAGLHAANAVLLLAVLVRLTGAFWRSAAVASIFALHPLRVESVAWAAERKDVLSALFWLLTMGAYLRYTRKPGTGRYLVVLGVFALGLTAKPMLVSLPFVLVLLDWWPLGRLREKGVANILREKAPFLTLTVISSIVTLYSQTVNVHPLVSADLPLRLSNALVSAVAYLGQFLWPAGLAVLYPYPRAGIPWWATAAALIALILMSVTVVLARRRSPFLLFGWLWYLVTLLPVSGIVQVGAQARADRYTYLTLLGITIALAWSVDRVWPRTIPARRNLAVAVGSLLIVLGIAATVQTSRWLDSLTILGHTVRHTTDNYIILGNLGLALIDARRFDEAALRLKEAVRSKPDYGNARSNLGVALAGLGRHDEAIFQYQEALRSDPADPDVLMNLGNALSALGRADEALASYREAVRVAPEHAKARYNLGVALAERGDAAGAAASFREAIRLDPQSADAHNNLGLILAAGRRHEEAAAEYRLVIAIDPRHALAHNNLGAVFAAQGRTGEAEAQFRRALEIEPDLQEARRNLSHLADGAAGRDTR